jgi:phage portal protein BeeE
MGLYEWIGLKAKKESVIEKKDSKNGFGHSVIEPPKDDMFKAYIPNFLYKPPFGYPLNKNVLHLKALAKNPYIFSVIKTLKDEASTTKWEIRIKKEFGQEVHSVKYDELIKGVSHWFYNPNGNEESFNDIVGQWIQDLCEVDAAVGVKVFSKGGDFSQLFARDGGSFLKNPDIFGYLGNRDEFVYPYTGMTEAQNSNVMADRIKIYSSHFAETAAYFQYGWTGNALPVPFGRREIIYISTNTRTDGIYGRSPLEVIEQVLMTLVYGIQYNTDFYVNGNMPEGLIHVEGADGELCLSLQEKLKSKFKTSDELLGKERRIGHTYPVWGGPAVNFVPFQFNAKDMEIIEQQKWFTKLVWSAFGVTPDQMGYTEDSNKAVSQTQTGVFKKKALRPLLRKIEYAVNTQILSEFDPSGVLEFCFEDYDLEEDMRRLQLHDLEIRMGIKSPRMVAEEEGIDLSKFDEFTEAKEEKEREQLERQNNNNSFGGDVEIKAEPKKKSEPIVVDDIESYFKDVKKELLDRYEREV